MNTVLSAAERFWARVRKLPDDGCWLWTGGVNVGYGAIWMNGNNMGAHRFSWELHLGAIPQEIFVCHKCDNRLCVRPSHLFLGTNADNQRDCVQKGRFTRAKFDPETAQAICDSFYKGDATIAELSKTYNRPFTTIRAIAIGNTWGCITGATLAKFEEFRRQER